MLRLAASVACAAFATMFVASSVGMDRTVSFGHMRAVRKAALVEEDAAAPPLLATLVDVHYGDHTPLGATEPPNARFDEMLADRTTGEKHELDPRLLDLLRQLAAKHPRARIELVSGFRSPKLNERLRKKGHNVASHSQHSLGHAVDFRIFPEADGGAVAEEGIEPAMLEQEIRALGWDGGVGIYPGKTDRFVHADVGPNRRWLGK